MAEADELARRHGLERIASENFPLLGGTIGLFRIVDRRPVETVRRELAADASVRSVQFNFRYFLQDQKKAPAEGDAAQYAVAQLRLPQAHQLARGMNVTIAVIDFRRRRQTSRTRQFGRRHLRCARKQGRSACPRHRHRGCDRRACPADGKRARGETAGDPRVRHRIEGRREHVLRDPQGAGLCGRARRADHQHELRRPEGSADRARHCRDRGAG